MNDIKTVHFCSMSLDLGTLQSLYLCGDTRRLRPNLAFVRTDGSTFFEINESGFKGGSIDPNRTLAVVWGDSVVFGIGPGWPCLLDGLAPGYQFLNGGIEGDSYRSVLARMTEFNQQQRVSLNILLPGWHPHRENDNLQADLVGAINATPNVVLATMPTALNERVVNEDLRSYLSPNLSDWTKVYLNSAGGEPEQVGFFFHGSLEYSVEAQKDVFGHITERNRIIREVAQTMNITLIDLFSAFDTTYTDLRMDFFDVPHPRPSAYPKLAETVHRGIVHLLR